MGGRTEKEPLFSFEGEAPRKLNAEPLSFLAGMFLDSIDTVHRFPVR